MASSDVKLQPLGKRIVVKPVEVEEKTAGGLFIPPSAQEGNKPEVGIVVKLGTGKKGFTFSVKVGDKIFFKKYAPDEIEVDGQKYYVMLEEDVLAIVQ